MSTGQNHSLVLTSNGRVFGFGTNIYGQAGSSSKQKAIVESPMEILFNNLNDDEKIVVVDALYGSSVAFTNKDSCYIWGHIVGNVSSVDSLRRIVLSRHIPEKTRYALHHAIFYKKTEIALRLLSSTNVNSRDDCGNTPLFFACWRGNEVVVRALLHKNASVDQKYACPPPISKFCEKKTLVDIASEKGFLSIVELLMSHKASFTIFSLIRPCTFGYYEIAKILVDHQIELHGINDKGYSPLMLACESGNEKLVELLLDHQANVDHVNNKGSSPLSVTCQMIRLQESTIIKYNQPNSIHVGFPKIISLLLHHHADTYIANDDSMTPIMIAINLRHVLCLQLLLQHVPALIHTRTKTRQSL
eukprot:CAMPEP_0117421988 /NCGR_PEP_ID=MMETSP0758-20121206/2927_1 /TAXON_ID=63605 /ORGANISM="Percolomonas cosmopolitus, Strain AE-1 (ATCC 50343)" /LENGTH=359 /DNA_ID=CAMNT_0005204357 /DNA_START=404 /DNA_END=1480 /DNA_ORIENTATION=-